MPQDWRPAARARGRLRPPSVRPPGPASENRPPGPGRRAPNPPCGPPTRERAPAALPLCRAGPGHPHGTPFSSAP